MAENTRGQTGILDRLFAAEISDRTCIQVIAFHGFLSYQCLVFHGMTRELHWFTEQIYGRQFAQDRIPSNSENSILRSLVDANNRA
jgi:hypothetical protein